MNSRTGSESSTPTESRDSDQSLLRRFQSGESDAATAIYLRYAQRLLRLAAARTGQELAVRLDPEDVVQSVFRTFFRRAAEGHYEVPDGEELWKLFLVIALNKIRGRAEYHRAAKRDVAHTRDFAKVEPFFSPHQSDEHAYQVLQMTIDDLLGGLSASQREIVMLRIAGNDVHSIATTTGRAKRSVERVLQTFRESLSQQLRQDE